MRINLTQETVQKKLSEGFKEYIRYCKVKSLSEHTIKFYEECYRNFTDFYPCEQFIDIISFETINDYILYLKKTTNLCNTSINTKIRGIRVMLYYFMKMGYLNEFKIQTIKAEKKIKQTYSDNELKLLLRKPNIKTCLFTEYRDWVVVNYLLSTGNRVSTIINIQINDINFDDDYIILKKTKNKKQQMIPLSNTLKRILLEYLKYRKGNLDDYLFCNMYGNKLTRNALENSIRKYNTRRGVMKTSIHLFRHTFAKKWILAGGDAFRLQKILGHSCLDIVKEYINMFSEDLQKDFHKFNALEQISESKNYIKI